MPFPEPLLSHLTPAERILLELCRSADPDPGQLAGTDPEVLREVVDLSIRHALQGLVFLNLSRSLPEGPSWQEIGSEIRQALSRIKHQTAFWDLEQDRILQGLARAGLQPLVLKGGALRRSVFESPIERVMSDLDILVRQGEVSGVLETLRSLGYENPYSEAAQEGFRKHHHHDRMRQNGFWVEVHWRLTRPESLTPLDADLFQQRARILRQEGGTELRVPSPEDMVLHTVSQIEQDDFQFPQLRRLVDLDRLLTSEGLDWDYACAEADKSGLSTPLAVALRLTNLMLGTPVPRRFLEGRGIPFVTRRAIAVMRPPLRLMRKRKEALSPENYLFGFWCLRGFSNRRRWIMRIASGGAAADPMAWVWERRDESEATDRSWITGAKLLFRLIGLQLAVLGTALGSAVSQGGRRDLRFWKAPTPIVPPPPR